jgi:hypothetical protein
MSKQIDLNALRNAVLTTQREGGTTPADDRRTILVTKEGQLTMAADATQEERRTMATVQQDTFHGRAETDAAAVRKFMPTSTRAHTSPDGVTGWLYSFRCAYGTQYTMFAYFDGSYYQVVVVDPPVEEKYCSPHTGHIYSDGRICFGLANNSGRASLQDAYAKSVLWAAGMSAMLLSGNETFPFSINNIAE